MRIPRPFRLRPAMRALLAAGLAAAAGSAAAVHVLAGPNLTVEFADVRHGYTEANQDRIDQIAWRASDGVAVTGWVANGGDAIRCQDALEFFGESGFTPLGTLRPAIGWGTWSKWSSPAPGVGVSKTRPPLACQVNRPLLPVTTRYEVPSEAAGSNLMKIVRQWQFRAGTDVGGADGLRSYVPRLPLARFHNVTLPRADGSTAVVDVFTCPLGCTPADWRGDWFAMEDDFGRGLMVIRAAGLPTAQPARLDIRFDMTSSSNSTAIVLAIPPAGLAAPVTETQYLCFYDVKTWPAARRAVAWPEGCTLR